MGYDSVSPVGLDDGGCHGYCGWITNLEFTAADLRRLMSKERDGEIVRRLSALALVLG